MKSTHRIGGYALLAIIAGIIIVTIFGQNVSFSLSFLREFFINAGPWGYLLFALLLIASIPLPIPSTPLMIIGGYVYGVVVGSIITFAAVLIGSAISFFLIRRYGRTLLDKLVDHHHIVHFSHLIQQRGLGVLFLCYMLPIFPSDAVSLLLGLTRIHIGLFLVMVIVGHIPRILLIVWLGEDLQTGFGSISLLAIGGVVLLALIALFREKIKKILFKELRFVEDEFESWEGTVISFFEEKPQRKENSMYKGK